MLTSRSAGSEMTFCSRDGPCTLTLRTSPCWALHTETRTIIDVKASLLGNVISPSLATEFSLNSAYLSPSTRLQFRRAELPDPATAERGYRFGAGLVATFLTHRKDLLRPTFAQNGSKARENNACSRNSVDDPCRIVRPFSRRNLPFSRRNPSC